MGPVGNETFESPDSLIRQFLVAEAEIHKRELSEQLVATYISALSDIPVREMKTVLNLTLREVKCWPTPADIREVWEALHSKQDRTTAEKAFDDLLKHIQKWGVDQIPHMTRGTLMPAPRFDEITESSMRACGGYRAIGNAPSDQTRFIRKAFIEAYCRYRETGAYLAPTRAEAAALLDQFPTDLVKKALK